MNLIRLILIVFTIYFARRIFQFYKFMKAQQKLHQQNNVQKNEDPETIDAEYKVID